MEIVNGVAEVHASSLGNALHTVSTFFGDTEELLFRGHRSHTWTIESSLRRALPSRSNIDLPLKYELSLARFAENLKRLGEPTAEKLAQTYLDSLHTYWRDIFFDEARPEEYERNVWQDLDWQISTEVARGLIGRSAEHETLVSKIEIRSALNRSRDALASVGQHYGLPTHLIDFTTSLPMGAYFAVSEQPMTGEKPTLIVFNKAKADDLQATFLRSRIQPIADEIFHDDQRSPKAVFATVAKPENNAVREEFLHHIRLRKCDDVCSINLHQRHQLGVLIGISAAYSLEGLLETWVGEASDMAVLRIVFDIPHDVLRRQCKSAGASAATAFQSIQGAASEAMQHVLLGA